MIHTFEQTVKRLIDFGLLTDKEQSEAIDFFVKMEDKIQPPTDYVKFLAEFNRITGKKYRPAPKSRELFYRQITVYSFEELVRCVENTQKNPYYVKEGSFKLKPEFVLTSEFLNTYINYSGPSKTNKNEPQNTPEHETFNGTVKL